MLGPLIRDAHNPFTHAFHNFSLSSLVTQAQPIEDKSCLT